MIDYFNRKQFYWISSETQAAITITTTYLPPAHLHQVGEQYYLEIQHVMAHPNSRSRGISEELYIYLNNLQIILCQAQQYQRSSTDM